MNQEETNCTVQELWKHGNRIHSNTILHFTKHIETTDIITEESASTTSSFESR